MCIKQTFLLLAIATFISCNGIVTDNSSDSSAGYEEIGLIKQKFEARQVPALLAGLSAEDAQKMAHYKAEMQALSDDVSKEWNVAPDKMKINCFVKTTGLKDSYKAYSYAQGQLLASTTVPQHIIDAFDKHFVCYTGDYWKPYNINKSVTFSWDEADTKMRVEVIRTN